MDNICFIDFETTGTNLLIDYPIQIGAVLVNSSLEVIKEYSSYIKPPGLFRIRESAFKVHGISEEILAAAPPEHEVVNEFFHHFGTGYRLAAWNMSFDVAFFKSLCFRHSYSEYLDQLNYRHLDVQTISFIAKQTHIIPQSVNSLSDLITHVGLRRSRVHSAKEDAKLLAEVYRLLMQKLRDKLDF